MTGKHFVCVALTWVVLGDNPISVLNLIKTQHLNRSYIDKIDNKTYVTSDHYAIYTDEEIYAIIPWNNPNRMIKR